MSKQFFLPYLFIMYRSGLSKILTYRFTKFFPKEKIRNFCIIAHIDHGKSTLADRLLQITNTIPKNSSNQYLDKLKVQRERGITVQAQTASMYYTYKGEQYLLNLVDTPGHVDFHYEVERSMRGCQGALLLVDATQGIQAQTFANYQLAKKQNLKVIPIMNKIDMICNIQEIESQIQIQLGLSSITKVSAKTGQNVAEILQRIIKQLPSPNVGLKDDKLKLFMLNSWFVNGKNVICLFYVMSGTIKKNMSIVSCAFNKSYQVFDVGLLQPELTSQDQLTPGQIGYVLSNMKLVKQARIGDTYYKLKQKVNPEPGFQPSKPMMYAGVYPVDPADFSQLQKNLQKLVLTDPAVTFVRQSNATLGNGFRCGFLGMLHMDVFRQRLEDQYEIDAILTSPSVPYKCKLKSGKIIDVQSAAQAPGKDLAEYFEEPMVNSTIVIPREFFSSIKSLCQSKRGQSISQNIIDNRKVVLKYKFPLSQIIVDFVDKLKSLTHGFGSFDYEFAQFQRSKVVKMIIHVMNQPVDALTFLVHEQRAYEFGKQICEKLKQTIPQQLFAVNIQARIGTRTIAKQQVPHIKKHVTAKCYGGDYSRKRKLIERYKQGKKKLKAIGKVQVGKDAFLHVMKQK